MEIEVETINDRFVLHVRGRADNSTSDTFRKLIERHVDDSTTDLILEFSGLEYISSAGLRVMLTIAKTIKANDGQAVLCGMSDLIKEIFEISGFVSLFKVADTLDAALEPS